MALYRRFIDTGLAQHGYCDGCQPLQRGEAADPAVWACVGEPGTGRERRFQLCEACVKILAARLLVGEG